MTAYERWEAKVDAAFPDNMMSCIDKFFREVHPTLKPGLDFYPEVFSTDLFFPLQRQEELRRMIQIARAVEPKVVMEIGADKGGGLYHWCQCLPTVEYVGASEIRGTPYSGLFIEAFHDIQFRFFGDSRETWKMQPDLTPPIDVLFIDGGKTRFWQDFIAYFPLMRSPGGVVFFHDVQEPGPMRSAWQRAIADDESPDDRRSELILDKRDWLRALERELRGIEPANPHEAWLRHWRGRSCGVGVVWL